METFSSLLAICAGNSPVPGEFPAQRPVMRSFDVFFDLRLNKRLSKQSWGWWFETPSCPLWHHCNVSFRISWILYLWCHLINKRFNRKSELWLLMPKKFSAKTTAVSVMTLSLVYVHDQGMIGSGLVWPGDSIWQHRIRSTLPQVMACCLMAPNHYLNQC